MENGFRVKVFSSGFNFEKSIGSVSNNNVTGNVTDNVTDRNNLIIKLIEENNKISTNDIADKLKVTKRTILRDIEKLKQQGKLIRLGNEKNGKWEVLK